MRGLRDYSSPKNTTMVKKEDYEFIQSRVYDNEVLMKSDPTYVKRLKALPEAQKKAWL